jgi:hypothetical protein
MENKKSKGITVLALILFGVAGTLAFQTFSSQEASCDEIRDDRVLSKDETAVQRRLRSTFVIATYQWLDPSTKKSVLEQARKTEAAYPREDAKLSLKGGELKIANFLSLTPKFQNDLLAAFEKGVSTNRSEAGQRDDLTVYSYTQEATTIISSNGKCFPKFRFAR